MSVLKDKRKLSAMNFYYLAQKATLTITGDTIPRLKAAAQKALEKNMSAAYPADFVNAVCRELYALSFKIMRTISAANSIYPSARPEAGYAEWQKRRAYQLDAICAAEEAQTVIQMIAEFLPHTTGGLLRLSDDLAHLASALRAWKTGDNRWLKLWFPQPDKSSTACFCNVNNNGNANMNNATNANAVVPDLRETDGRRTPENAPDAGSARGGRGSGEIQTASRADTVDRTGEASAGDGGREAF